MSVRCLFLLQEMNAAAATQLGFRRSPHPDHDLKPMSANPQEQDFDTIDDSMYKLGRVASLSDVEKHSKSERVSLVPQEC